MPTYMWQMASFIEIPPVSEEILHYVLWMDNNGQTAERKTTSKQYASDGHKNYYSSTLIKYYSRL